MADTKIADSEPLVVIVRAFPMCKADKLNDFLVKNADGVGKMHSISSGGIKLPRQGKGRENADRVGKLIQKVANNGFSASRRRENGKLDAGMCWRNCHRAGMA